MRMDNKRCSHIFLTKAPSNGRAGTYLLVKEKICSEAQTGTAFTDFRKESV